MLLWIYIESATATSSTNTVSYKKQDAYFVGTRV